MRRGLGVSVLVSLAMVLLFWAADVSAKSGGGGFRSGGRATRDDGGSGGSGFSSDPGSGSDQSYAEAPPRKRSSPLRHWLRSLFPWGPIGRLLAGRDAAQFGVIVVLIFSGLIVLAFRALSRAQVSPFGHYVGAATYGGGGPAFRSAGFSASAAPEAPESLERGLSEIRRSDPMFDTAGFARIVDSTFREVQAAWTARDIGRAADVLTAEMRQKLQRECDRLRAIHRVNRVESIVLRRAAITEARQERGWDVVTVAITASLIDYTTDDAGLKVISGNPFEPVQCEERWKLIRPSGPRAWRVSAIH